MTMHPSEHGWSYLDDAISGRTAEPHRQRSGRPDRFARRVAWLALALAASAILLSVGPGLAHEHWISQGNYRDPVSGASCCGEEDCAPVPAGGVKERRGGWHVVETGEVIPFVRTLDSPDGQFWRCRFLGGPNRGRTRCLFAPGMGS